MIIARGAEAIVTRSAEGVRKERPRKGYRHPALDARLRRLRTRAEARLLRRATKAGVPVPVVLSVEEDTMLLSDVAGEPLGVLLESDPDLARTVGEIVARLHAAHIIHGDLTTSNILVRDGTPYLLDFGLGFSSRKVEDKAVDIHVFLQTLRGRHHVVAEEAIAAFMEGYDPDDALRARLEEVGARGKNK